MPQQFPMVMAEAGWSSLARLHGLFAVQKPVGITSAKVVEKLKAALKRDLDGDRQDEEGRYEREDFSSSQSVTEISSHTRLGASGGRRQRQQRSRLKLPKMGHGGTLDMDASGVLVIGCGNATKKLATFLQGEKTYQAEGRLGTATDTMDAGGKVVETATYDHVTQDEFRKILNLYRGEILQVPPVYSALKVGGERMSDLAARGEAVEPKEARPVTVYHLSCLKFEPPLFKLEIKCGGGFYVRKLIHDVGKSLGTCAHMTSLCRTQQGCFTLNDSTTLPQDRWTLQDILSVLDDSSQRTLGVR